MHLLSSPIRLLCRMLPFAGLCMATAMAADTDRRDFVRAFENSVIVPIVEDTPGSALVVVLDGRVALQKAYGVRQQHRSAPVTNKTLFRIASISKTFASAAAAILIEEEPISWQTPLVSQLQDLHFKRADYGNRITLHHLMSQSSGLMPHAYTNLIEDNMPYQRIIKRLHKVDFVCAPGECYGYQNVVFSLVGDVIQELTDMNYPSYVTKKIFEPLQMNRASFGLDAFIEDDDHAEPHLRDRNDWVPVRTTHHYYRVPPAAGMNASIDDMKEWLLAQLGQKPRVLPPAALDAKHRGAVKTTVRQAHYGYRRRLGDVYYGLGWRVFDYDGHENFAHHGGYVRGMRSEMMVNRDLQIGLVFLTNSEPARVNDLIFDFLDLYRLHQQTQRVADTHPANPGITALPSTD
ncbi:MAG: serine hydrolase domain-containing protein [Pseudomonadales bacterium]|nr:serine hydrolase domain-containing protein [Pseudomonadales bacterium]MDP7595933.1 serine hydrolase domain-containing protein [Pseudomonadales bacterium]HJN49280.1 serine hydrolase domain-containing protein [Pseudomonadales bacterium]